MDLAASNLPIKRDFHHFYIIFLIFAIYSTIYYTSFLFVITIRNLVIIEQIRIVSWDNNKYFIRWIKSKKISFSCFFSTLIKDRDRLIWRSLARFFPQRRRYTTASSPRVVKLYSGRSPYTPARVHALSKKHYANFLRKQLPIASISLPGRGNFPPCIYI